MIPIAAKALQFHREQMELGIPMDRMLPFRMSEIEVRQLLRAWDGFLPARFGDPDSLTGARLREVLRGAKVYGVPVEITD